MTPSSVTITQERYDELREAERFAYDTKRENYNAERLQELERQYRELSDAVYPTWFTMDIPHGDLVEMAAKHLDAYRNELHRQKETESTVLGGFGQRDQSL